MAYKLSHALKPLRTSVGFTSRAYAIKIGDSASMTRVFTAQHVQTFADLTLDDNPIHVNEEFAKTTRYGRAIVHGTLTLGLQSGVLGNKFPGHGSVLIDCQVQYPAPLFVGEEVTAEVTLSELRGRRGVFDLKCYATENNSEKVVLQGKATILVPKHLVKT